jgi:two-component system chemotaxis sensor kinase CheA
MNLDAAVQTFLVESRELLDEMEHSLLHLETDAADHEQINSIFRAAHTIKGSAGLFDFETIVSFTHHVESLLEKMRSGAISIEDDGIALLLACVDHMRTLLEPAVNGQPLDEQIQVHGEVLLQRLKHSDTPTHSTMGAAAHQTIPMPSPTLSVAQLGDQQATTECWHISLRFGRDVLRNGMDPLAFLRYLTTLGDIVHLTTLTDAMPVAEELDPETCYLGFEVGFKSEADKATIENVFEFVRDDCLIRILPPHSKLSDYIRLIHELPEDKIRLGDLLVASGALTSAELDCGLYMQAEEDTRAGLSAATDAHTRPLGEILVQQGTVDAAVVNAALDKQQQSKERKAQESRFIRVEAEKLDQLITLVGELVIAGAGTSLLAQRAGLSEILESTSTLARLVEEVRNSTMSLRIVQIGATFQRFERVVRDVSRDLGKDIVLAISGGDTELDKSVVEKLGDPLMHLIRNAMDHGIEPKELRVARGKPAQARVMLNAYHDAGSIVIEVTDDGGGLNRDKILQKALARGLVTPSQTLTEQETWGLIFEPGFSTAATVSNLSGRGVGMDVVKRNIETLRGTVELDSQAERGTTVRIRLPLTLAIIDGFLVGVSHARYVIPLDMVRECLELTADDRQTALDRGYISLRGEVLPLVQLRDLFAIDGTTARRANIVVVRFSGLKAGLIVDTLLGEFQTVIKPVGKLFSNLKCMSGFTILGSGDVALILDIPRLLQHITNTVAAQYAAA